MNKHNKTKINFKTFFPFQKRDKRIPLLKYVIGIFALLSLICFFVGNLIIIFVIKETTLQKNFSFFMGKMISLIYPVAFLLFTIQGFKKNQSDRKKYGFSKIYAFCFIIYNLYLFSKMIIILQREVINKGGNQTILTVIQVINYLNGVFIMIMIILEIGLLILWPKISRVKIHNFNQSIFAKTRKNYVAKKIRHHKQLKL